MAECITLFAILRPKLGLQHLVVGVWQPEAIVKSEPRQLKNSENNKATANLILGIYLFIYLRACVVLTGRQKWAAIFTESSVNTVLSDPFICSRVYSQL